MISHWRAVASHLGCRSWLWWLALAVGLGGLLARLAAFGWNDTPHEDVTVNALVAESIVEEGFAGMPFFSPRSYSLKPFGDRTPLDYQPPSWPFLISLLVPMTGDGYAAAKLLSLVAGVFLPLTTFLTFGKVFGRTNGLLSALAVACSYLLVDFSGNGSVYLLLSHCFLLFVYVWTRPPSPRSALLLGAVLGGAYHLHRSSVVLWAALLAVAWLRWRRGSLERPGRFLALAYGMAVSTLMPLVVYNTVQFGDPLFQSQTMYYPYKLGVPWEAAYSPDAGLTVSFDWSEWDAWRGVKTVVIWTAQNGYYMVRKLLELGSVFSLAAALGAVPLLVRSWRSRDWPVLTAIIVCVGFAALCVLWPVVKFRTFTILLPFVFAFGIEALRNVSSPRLRRLALGTGFTVLVGLSVASYFASPTRTFYFDGALTPDTFGKRGEAIYMERDAELRRIAALLEKSPRGPVLSGEVNLAYYQDHPLVNPLPGMSAELARQVLAGYGIRYVVGGRDEVRFFGSLVPTAVLLDGSFFTLVEVIAP